MLNGIDISRWQGSADLGAAMRAGCEFFIARASYGPRQPDAMYGFYRDQARSIGALFGSYHFATAQASPETEADAYLSAARWQPGEILVLDLEREVETGLGILAMGNPVDWALRFLRRVFEVTGVRPLIYMSGSVCNEFDWSPVVSEDYGLWVAHWDTDNPIIGQWPFWALHQTTSSGSFPGFAGRLDVDRFNGDAAAWLRYGSSAGAAAPAPAPVEPQSAPVEKTIDQLANEVLAGQWGDGDDRRNRLSREGYNYVAVQARVNELLTPPKSDDQLADEVLAGLHGDGDARRAELGDRYDAVQAIVNQRVGSGGGRRQIDTYAIQPGDNLTDIAHSYPQGDVTIESIAIDNGIADRNAIRAGDTLAIFSAE